MTPKSAFLVLAIIFVISSSVRLAPQAVAQEEAQPVKSALAHCLEDAPGTLLSASDPKKVPPGLIEGLDVNVGSLPGTDGNAFSYEGIRTSVILCGIAIYGRVPVSLLEEIRQLIDGYPEKWMPHTADAYTVSGVPAYKAFWGQGNVGVLMLVREPSPNAPTLEVEYHSILLH